MMTNSDNACLINSKMHNAGVRVLTLLKILVENDISVKDIMKNTRKEINNFMEL